MDMNIPTNILKLIGKNIDILNNEIISEIQYQNKIIKRPIKDIIEELPYLNNNSKLEKYTCFDNEGNFYTKNENIKKKEYISQKYYIRNFAKDELKYYADLLGINYITIPIKNFYFFCHIHGDKNSYYCLDCNMHLCEKCKELSSLSPEREKILLKAFINTPSKGFNYGKILKIFLNENKFKNVDEALKFYLNKNNKILHKKHNLIKLNKYKLSQEEIQYYTEKIQKYGEILENTKDSKNMNVYKKNVLLLCYCKKYFEFYKTNLEIGLNYSIIYNIRKNIKFNEKFLIENNKEDNNELILNIPFFEEEKSILLMKAHNISISSTQKSKDNIEAIFLSDDRSKFIISINEYGEKKNKTLKIYQLIDFTLLHTINFTINFCYYRNTYAKFLSNGNIIVSLNDMLINYIYMIKFENHNIIKERISHIELGDTTITEIKKNNHYIFGIIKNYKIQIYIYDYNFQLILKLTPFHNKTDSFICDIIELLYISNINILLCIDKCRKNYNDNYIITVWSTKNSIYKIKWYKSNIKTEINIIKDKYLLFDYGIYNIINGEFIYKINIDFNCIFFGTKIIYLKNEYLIQSELEKTKESCVEKNSISKLTLDKNKKNKIIKITDEIFCIYNKIATFYSY